MAKGNRRWSHAPVRPGRRARISGLLARIEQKINSQVGKATFSDYIRLIQLEREMEQDEPPREIKVTWIEQRKTPRTDE